MPTTDYYATTNTLDSIKIKNLCSSEEKIKSEKASHRLGEDIQKHISKKITFRIYKVYAQVIMKQNQKTREQRLGHLTKEDIQVANKYIKKCSFFSVTRKIQIKPLSHTITLPPKWLK